MTTARLMSGPDAAAYLGLTPTCFSKWVAEGRIPKPLPGTRHWDRKAIDLYVARLNPYPRLSTIYLSEVYFIECGDFIKIGFSSCTQERLANLQTSTPYDLNLIGAIAGDHEVEGNLHRMWWDHHHRGEWFRKTESLLAYIEWLLSRNPYQPNTEDFRERMVARWSA